jgi:uncharacterized membrane protein HdeD (DUF308 family)
MSTLLSPTARSDAATPYGMPFPAVGIIKENLKDLRDSWFWIVLLGGALIVLGLALMSYTGMVWATVAATLVFGCFMVASGIAYLVGAFFTRGWGGFFLSLLAGVLYLAAGVVLINHPQEAAILYTLMLAVFFFVEGLFRIVGALAGQFRHWGWVLLSGVMTLALGVMIWRQWPLSGLYVIGLFLGIDLVISGASYVSLGLAARKLPV